MHVAQLLDSLARTRHIEVVETLLPNWRQSSVRQHGCAAELLRICWFTSRAKRCFTTFITREDRLSPVRSSAGGSAPASRRIHRLRIGAAIALLPAGGGAGRGDKLSPVAVGGDSNGT